MATEQKPIPRPTPQAIGGRGQQRKKPAKQQAAVPVK